MGYVTLIRGLFLGGAIIWDISFISFLVFSFFLFSVLVSPNADFPFTL
jgi:hypothetical protein